MDNCDIKAKTRNADNVCVFDSHRASALQILAYSLPGL